jgi:uncharacterized protein YdaT
MPWTPKTFAKKHNHGLTPAAAKRAARAANAVLKRTGDDGQAVRVGNAIAKKGKP